MSLKSSYNDEEKLQIKMLIEHLPYNFRYDNISMHRKTPFDINEELLWKDFILKKLAKMSLKNSDLPLFTRNKKAFSTI